MNNSVACLSQRATESQLGKVLTPEKISRWGPWRSFLGRYSTGSKHTGRLRQQEFLPVNDLIRVQLKLLA